MDISCFMSQATWQEHAEIRVLLIYGPG